MTKTPWNKGKSYSLSDRRSQTGGHFPGETIGPGVLVEHAGTNAHGHHLWMWKCATCGGERGPSTLAHMKRSKICLDCSCERDNNPRWKGHRELSGVWLGRVQADAKKRGIEWDVTAKYLWGLWIRQSARCVYSKRKLTHGVDASLDRIDNTKGYVRGNVQWVHRNVNRMKSDFTEQEFIELCKEVARSV